jgi:transposase
MARIIEALGRHRFGHLSCVEAAEYLGMSERHFRRLRDRHEAEGAEGLIDRRRGRKSGRAAAVDRIEWMLEEYRTRYWDFNALHFHERITVEHGWPYGYTLTKRELQKAGLIKRVKKRSAHRKKRERRPLPGMMLMQDGSPFRWIPALDEDFDLIATMDDATGEVYSAFLVDEEGPASTFMGLTEVIAAKGLFSSLYTDRGSHYFYTPKAGGKVDKDKLTQVGRALKQLGVQHIPSYSPEARGRMERLFQTLQGRLPQELRLAGITDVGAANRYIRDVFLPAFNAQFAVPATEDGTAFVPWAGGAQALAEILCVQEERQVGKDNCVRYNGLSLQIPAQAHRHHFVKATVTVKQYPDGSMAIFHGPRCLARYRLDGTLPEAKKTAA